MIPNTSFLGEEERTELVEYLYDKTGIDYAEAVFESLDACVRRRAKSVGVENAALYVKYVKDERNCGAELMYLMEPVSTGETFFFRHANQIKAFKKLMVQMVADQRASGDRSLKIWVAACSTGEEPYSLAMIVKDLIGDENDWDIILKATDIIPQRIEKARTAHFSERSIRHVDEELVAKYFTANSEGDMPYALCDEVASMVEFHAASLVGASEEETNDQYDVVFCRNVLGFFDETAKKKALSTLHDRLKPGGYLVLGPAESPSGLSDAFQRCPYSVHNFFKKPENPVGDGQREEASAATTEDLSAAKRLPHLIDLVQFIDRGTCDIRVDIDSSLSSAIEMLSAVADALNALQDDTKLTAEAREKIEQMDQQFMRAMLFLQVGDRITQKSEALRAALQELSDYLIGDDAEAPDLNVSISSFDENILPAKSDEERDENAMSQDDIDALFGS